MNKILKSLTIVTLLVTSTLLLSACTNEPSSDSDSINMENVETSRLIIPDRPAEINGLVRSIEGNEVTIAKEIKENNLTEEEREAQKTARATMTQEERQAFKAETAETIETENVTLIIPVGVPIIKGSGVADGENITAELSEIKSGVYVSVWLNENEVEAVKLKGIN